MILSLSFIDTTCPLKKIYDILKIQISKKITYSVIFSYHSLSLRTHIDV